MNSAQTDVSTKSNTDSQPSPQQKLQKTGDMGNKNAAQTAEATQAPPQLKFGYKYVWPYLETLTKESRYT